MNILCFYSHEPEKTFLLEKFGKNISFLQGEIQDYTPAELAPYAEYEIITCFTGSKCGRDVLSLFPNLKLIAVRSTGFDNIDLAYCREHNIVVSNVPLYGQNTVAEYAFSLILDIARKTHSTYEKVKKDLDFSRRGAPDIQGFDLSGKTIGIVGMGQIGKNVAQIAHGFDMRILAYDLSPDPEVAKKYDVQYVDLPELLGEADIITLHLPHNKQTHHLLSRDEFNIMKKGVVFINTSRGEIVDTIALYEALESGTVSAAGLDVVEGEKFLGRETIDEEEKTPEMEKVLEVVERFIETDNVVITPHNAFNTREAIERILATTAENIQSFIDGTPTHVVE